MRASAPAPAWYEDPYDAAHVRWWNGQAWTTAVREHPAAGPSPPPTPAPPAPAAAPPPTPTPPPEPAPAAAPAAAPSIGAALLPPLTPPASPQPAAGSDPPGSDTGEPVRPRRSNRLRLVLVAGIVVAALALAAAALSSGMLGGSSNEAQGSAAVEGPDFSVDAPDGWSEVDPGSDLPANAVVALRGPGGATLGILRSEDAVEVPDDPEVRRRMIDLLVATQASTIDGAQLLDRVPATLGGVEGELLTMQGAAPSGETEQAYQLVALHDGRMYLVMLAGPTELVTASKPDFDAIVASFRFD